MPTGSSPAWPQHLQGGLGRTFPCQPPTLWFADSMESRFRGPRETGCWQGRALGQIQEAPPVVHCPALEASRGGRAGKCHAQASQADWRGAERLFCLHGRRCPAGETKSPAVWTKVLFRGCRLPAPPPFTAVSRRVLEPASQVLGVGSPFPAEGQGTGVHRRQSRQGTAPPRGRTHTSQRSQP